MELLERRAQAARNTPGAGVFQPPSAPRVGRYIFEIAVFLDFRANACHSGDLRSVKGSIVEPLTLPLSRPAEFV